MELLIDAFFELKAEAAHSVAKSTWVFAVFLGILFDGEIAAVAVFDEFAIGRRYLLQTEIESLPLIFHGVIFKDAFLGQYFQDLVIEGKDTVAFELAALVEGMEFGGLESPRFEIRASLEVVPLIPEG